MYRMRGCRAAGFHMCRLGICWGIGRVSVGHTTTFLSITRFWAHKLQSYGVLGVKYSSPDYTPLWRLARLQTQVQCSSSRDCLPIASDSSYCRVMRDRWRVSGGVSVIGQAHTNASSDSVQHMHVVAAALIIQDCWKPWVIPKYSLD